jgi:D-alanyl-D-alanine carboxypeptidase
MFLSKPAHTIVEERRFGQSDFAKNFRRKFGTAKRSRQGRDGEITSRNSQMDDYQERIAQILRELGAPPRKNSAGRVFAEALELESIGPDIYGREQRLTPQAAAAWNAMKTAAEQDGETLQAVSAFRSVEYQKQIVQKKLAAGQSWEQILRVSALPGYSEHHTGRTIDITTAGCKPLTEEFEATSAFAWLQRRAGEFGFTMTYPRDNQLGVAYEPWHWTLQERFQAAEESET